MTILLTDGFELSDDKTFAFAKWTGSQTSGGTGSVSYATTNQHHGAHCFNASINTGGVTNRWANLYLTITANPCHIREYVQVNQITSVNAANTHIMAFAEENGQTFAVYGGMYNNAGQPQWVIRYQNGGSFYNALGPNCSLNKEYCVELAAFRVASSTTGWAKLWVDGKLTISVTSINIVRTLSYACVGHCYSRDNSADRENLYIDCVAISNEYIGPENPMFSSRRHHQLRTKRGNSGQQGRLYLK